MNTDGIRRAQLIIAIVGIVAGLVAILYTGFDLSGAGERALTKGDSYFFASLFHLNTLGGLVLVAVGVLGVIASRSRAVVFGWLGAALAGVAALVILVGAGDSDTLLGQGNPSNAAVFLIVAAGLATCERAATLERRYPTL